MRMFVHCPVTLSVEPHTRLLVVPIITLSKARMTNIPKTWRLPRSARPRWTRTSRNLRSGLLSKRADGFSRKDASLVSFIRDRRLKAGRLGFVRSLAQPSPSFRAKQLTGATGLRVSGLGPCGCLEQTAIQVRVLRKSLANADLWFGRKPQWCVSAPSAACLFLFTFREHSGNCWHAKPALLCSPIRPFIPGQWLLLWGKRRKNNLPQFSADAKGQKINAQARRANRGE